MNKTVKETLCNMLVLELAGLGAILGITVIILTVLYQFMQDCQYDNIEMMQQIQSVQYENIRIQNTNYKLMLSDEEENRNAYDTQANELDMALQKELKSLKKNFPESGQAVGTIQKLLQQAFAYRSQAVLLAVTDKRAEAVAVMEEKYQPVMDDVNSRLEELSVQSDKNVNKSLRQIKRSIFLFGGIGTAVIVFLGMYITRKQKNVIQLILEPLNQVQQAMGEMAEGNLEFQIAYHRKNEFGQLAKNLEFTGERLKSYVNDISDVLGKVADKDFTVELSADYKGAFAPIGLSMEHIVSSIANVIGNIKTSSQEVLENAEDLNIIADKLLEASTKEKENAKIVEKEMDRLLEATKENLEEAEHMNEISAKSDILIRDGHIAVRGLASVIGQVENTFAQITDILVLITEISEQIKLLTLNASIEAAKAGERGNGFAVLANQMRNLVEKSQEATGKTEKLLINGSKVIREGQGIAEDVLEKFLGITDIEDCLVKKAQWVENVSKQQEAVLYRVYEVTEEMVQMAMGYDTVSLEIKQQGEQVSHLVRELTEEMNRFKI